MVKKLKPLLVRQTLLSKQLSVFTPAEFKRVFDVTSSAMQAFLSNHSQGKNSLFTKLKNGLYTLTDSPRNHYLIANKLYQPSYISFETALSYHKLIPETIYSITSATPKATREFETDGIAYTYRKVKRSLFTGYSPIKYQGNTVLMAEPEKALTDYLYFVDLGLLSMSYERLDLKKVKKQKLYKYIKALRRPSLTDLTNKLYVDQGKS